MMTDVLKALLGSKKFISAVLGVVAVIGVRYTGLPEEQILDISHSVLGVVLVLIGAQGAADLGKEGKHAEASAMVAMTAMEAGFTESDSEVGDE